MFVVRVIADKSRFNPRMRCGAVRVRAERVEEARDRDVSIKFYCMKEHNIPPARVVYLIKLYYVSFVLENIILLYKCEFILLKDKKNFNYETYYSVL